MQNIFISYKREQREWVRKLVLALESCGLSVWWDPKIEVGEEYFKVINKVIKEVDCILVIWSHDSVGSQWVMSEATVGMERKNIVPVLLDEIIPPIPFNIIQSADLTTWKGDVNHEGFEQLLASIQKHCKVELKEKNSEPIVETQTVLPQTQTYSLLDSTNTTEEVKESNRDNKALEKLRQMRRKKQLLIATLIIGVLTTLIVLKKLGV